ncbi:MAG TPA: transglutaminase-like domain-containing protein [Sandaracinaceae bacterium LLY-WYZ-13_1]|nr:transglutaminase-like domain-containing protein [Sandaracinaceae bacterium LLY-WYZ-13_1]
MLRNALSRAVADDDVEGVAVALAADHDPALRPGDVRGWLDVLALRLSPAVEAVHGPRRLGRLVHGVYRTLGFSTPDRYEDPRLHLIGRVLDRREGSPVALAVVAQALGRRLGVPLRGVAFPGHFMLRYEASAPVFVDPSSGAFPFPAESLLELAAEELRVPVRDAERFLRPVGARTVAVRLLQNLQRAHEERGDLGRALLVADRLYEVTGSPMARCDRGLRAAALGAPHAAYDDLTAYLRDHRDADVRRAVDRLRPTSLDLN